MNNVESLQSEIASLKTQLVNAQNEASTVRRSYLHEESLKEALKAQLEEAKWTPVGIEVWGSQTCNDHDYALSSCLRKQCDACIRSRWLVAERELVEAKAEVERLSDRNLVVMNLEAQVETAGEQLAASEREVARLELALFKIASSAEATGSYYISANVIAGYAKAALTPKVERTGCRTCHHLIGYHHDGPAGEACTARNCACQKYVTPTTSSPEGAQPGS